MTRATKRWLRAGAIWVLVWSSFFGSAPAQASSQWWNFAQPRLIFVGYVERLINGVWYKCEQWADTNNKGAITYKNCRPVQSTNFSPLYYYWGRPS